MSIKQALLMLPSFCWQDLFEVLIYVEQLADHATTNNVAVTLGTLIEMGLIETKQAVKSRRTKGKRHVWMYKRREPA